MFTQDKKYLYLQGPAGRLPLPANDEVARKLAMLFEGGVHGTGARGGGPEAWL